MWDVPSNITVEKTGSTLVLEIDKTGKFRDEVCEIIRHFDPDTILFLRKLKLVEIKTYQYVGPDIFRREEFRAEDGTTHVIIRENGICKSWFKIFESPVRNLTPRPRYPSVQDSIIKLAFPVDAKFEHAKEFPNAQQVYTFLPIANYGPGVSCQTAKFLSLALFAYFQIVHHPRRIRPYLEPRGYPTARGLERRAARSNSENLLRRHQGLEPVEPPL